MTKPSDSPFPANALWNLPLAWQEYWLDTAQRWVLSLDVLRQRGNAYVERTQEIAPHVLNFAASLLIDGRKLERPVNYVLVEIVPPKGITIDPHRRPFIIFDPRAGHGPGIGGMKHDSEIGVALREGHPCYFVGFLPEPVPRPDGRGRLRSGSAVRRNGDRSPSAGGRPAGPDRELPGGMANHDDVRGTAGPGWSHHAGGVAALLLGGRARQKPDALFRRPAGRHVADSPSRRSRQRCG